MTARVPLLACVAVLAFFAGITGIRLAYTLAYVLILLLAVAYIWSRLLARKLRVTRESPQGSFMMGEPFEETFTVKNASGLRLPYCEVRDATKLPGYAPGRAFSLAAGGSVTWTARGVFNLRGVHRFGPLEARLGDPFGLFPQADQGGARKRGHRLPGAPRAPAGGPAVERQRRGRGSTRSARRRPARRVDHPGLRSHRRPQPHPLGVDGAHRAADQPHLRHRAERRPARRARPPAGPPRRERDRVRRSSTRCRSAPPSCMAPSAAARRSAW